MKKIELAIDSSKHDSISIRLTMVEREAVLNESFDFRKSQGILPMIQKLLLQEGIGLNEITQIQVNPGPGSFTGIRVGVAIANTLGVVLQIPINGNPSGVPVEPIYK